MTKPDTDKSPEDIQTDLDDPNSFQSLRLTSNIILSYWIVIFLCVPYWWYSTTIERHSLPLKTIAEWQSKGPCPIRLPIHIKWNSDGIPINSDTKSVLFSGGPASSAERCLDFRIADDESASTTYEITVISSDSKQTSVQFVGDYAAHIRAQNLDDVKRSLASIFTPHDIRGRQISQDSRTVEYSRQYKLVYSLLNEDYSQAGVSEWEVESALERNVYPLLRSVKELHRFDVESQIQYFAPLAVQRTLAEGGAIIEEDQLKAFVNSADWNLASSVSSDPVLHFILFVPSASTSPLRVRRKNGALELLEAFLIPQWGGVVLVSLNSTYLTSSDLEHPFSTFSSQLSSLLGIPTISGAGHPLHRGHWKSSALMRERTIQNVRESIERLGALARQVKEIKNMRIPLAVQSDVRGVLEALPKIQTSDIKEAMRQSAIALDLAKRASFNHEMLALLYFPDEHKWAVYTPLFGPIAVPLAVALLREFKAWRQRRHGRKNKLKAE